MALVDQVALRYSNARLVALTNPDQPGSTTTVDSARLAAAAADAEAEFRAVCGVAYDDTDARHVAVAVLAVEWKLLAYTGLHSEVSKTVEAAFLAAAERYALTGGGRHRVGPATSSPLQPSVQESGTRPDFDREHFQAIQLRPPRGRSTDDRPDA